MSENRFNEIKCVKQTTSSGVNIIAYNFLVRVGGREKTLIIIPIIYMYIEMHY